MTVEVLTSAKGLMENISPTGAKYVVEHWPANNALWRIRSTNKTGPEAAEVSGTYTSAARAQQHLTKYLTELWAMSDAVEAKNKARKA